MKIRAVAVLTFGAVLAAGAGEAQFIGPGRGPQSEQSGQQTKLQALDRSLEALLNDGYEIRAADSGMLILAKSRGPWAMCNIRITNGMMMSPSTTTSTTSVCWALN